MRRRADGLYARVGRPSIPPERLLRAQLLQVFYSIRSERLLMEQLDYNLLFRWFVGLSMDDAIWAPTVFTKNRDRLLHQEIAPSFFRRVVERAAPLMSDEHFTVDGTLIEAWASQKSFQRPTADRTTTGATFGASRGRTTRMRRRPIRTPGCIAGRIRPSLAWPISGILIENRHGLIVDAMATVADGYAERDAATLMVHDQWHRAPWRRRTVGADKGYDTFDFVEGMRAFGTTPHVAQNHARRGGSAIDGRTTRQAGYAQSQQARPRIEPAFGWLKTIAWLRKVKLRGLPKVDWLLVFASAAFNLLRLPKLQPAPV